MFKFDHFEQKPAIDTVVFRLTHEFCFSHSRETISFENQKIQENNLSTKNVPGSKIVTIAIFCCLLSLKFTKMR